MTIQYEKNSREPMMCPDITLGRYNSAPFSPSGLMVTIYGSLVMNVKYSSDGERQDHA
jgi:hypothetical protein